VTPDDDLFRRLVALRRDLHRHPELGWELERTAGRIADALGALGIRARRIAGTAVVADLPGGSPGPAIALRADMDALPITESTGLPFASKTPGVMHACGHDGHVSALVGAAALLRTVRLRAPVRLIFQPAEETAEGARTLITHGVLDGVNQIFGLHLDVGLPVGVVAAPDGPVNASTDEFRIVLTGTGGHAARPHAGTDPVVAAGFLLTALQTIVTRRVPASEPAVVTVGRIDGGTASNVLAETVRLHGTIRATTPAVQDLVRAAVEEIAAGVAATHGAAVTVTYHGGTPPVLNDPAPTGLARRAAEAVVGSNGVRSEPLHNMGGEDFGFYLERVPGSFVRIGAQIADGRDRRAHSSRFDFDERAIGIAAAYLATIAAEAGKGRDR
jgi:hippurate hydrolase